MPAKFTKKKVLSLIGVLVIAGISYVVKEYQAKTSSDTTEQSSQRTNNERHDARGNDDTSSTNQKARRKTEDDRADRTTDAHKTSRGEEAIMRAFRDGESDVIVELEARVLRTLADDNEGSRHQRFILELSNGHTVLVAHNIDLAERVPLSQGDRIEIKGEYEWSNQGGVIHWTHHDPKQWREGGWIKHDGVMYE